jgi:hypothetical protein
MRQARPARQYAAFAMPVAHKSTLEGSSWQWEVMAGAFSRHVVNDNLWWAVGVFADVGPDDDVFLPYLGASWAINEAWTLSAILPWPAVLYAPSSDMLLRFGAAPSGTWWSYQPGERNVQLSIDTWDLGVGFERRLFGDFWGGLEIGVGGMRGLRLSGGDFEGADVSVDSSPYATLALRFRPGLPP